MSKLFNIRARWCFTYLKVSLRMKSSAFLLWCCKFKHSHALVDDSGIQLHIVWLFGSLFLAALLLLLLGISGSSCWLRQNMGSLLLSGDTVEHISAFLAVCPPLSLALLSGRHRCRRNLFITLTPIKKKKTLKCLGKCEDFQHSKPVSYAVYLRLYKPTSVCWVALFSGLCQNPNVPESGMWIEPAECGRSPGNTPSWAGRPTRLHYSFWIYWASGTKLFINIDLVPGR